MAKRVKRKPAISLAPAKSSALVTSEALIGDLRELILQARGHVAAAVNSSLVLLYWEVGLRIRTEVLKSARATYGEEIVPTLSAPLEAACGDGNC